MRTLSKKIVIKRIGMVAFGRGRCVIGGWRYRGKFTTREKAFVDQLW